MMTGRRANTILLLGTVAAIVAIVTLGVLPSSAAHESGTDVRLSAMAGAPQASGEAEIEFTESALQGSISVEDLPPQPFGSGRFYGVWFVRTDTGSKAFLGALIAHRSIIVSKGGDGSAQFAATQFTTGPAAASPIVRGPAGTNLIIVLIENNINGLSPSPVGPVPGSGAAVAGSF